jgi:AcrR family transcriptional regulator
MQVTKVEGTADRSFTAMARRAQIIDATIETIAEQGYSRASFSRIALRVGLSSTRLISYHFAGKQELIDQVTAKIITGIGSFVAQRLAPETTASGALRGYIRATIQYIAEHRTEMKALLAILLSGALSPGDPLSDNPPSEDVQPENQDQSAQAHIGMPLSSPVEQILRDGQRAGEFRQFDTLLVATSIQRSIEAIPMLLETHPDLDLEACAQELITLFDLAVRNTEHA